MFVQMSFLNGFEIEETEEMNRTNQAAQGTSHLGFWFSAWESHVKKPPEILTGPPHEWLSVSTLK